MSGSQRGFRLLGPVGMVVDGHEVLLGATREASLLADLLVHANEVVPTSRLVDDLWRGAPPPGAVATLHTYVRNVRRLLEPSRAIGERSEVLIARRPGYVLRVQSDELDASRARRLIEEGRVALAIEDPARHASSWLRPSTSGAGRRSDRWPVRITFAPPPPSSTSCA